MDARTPEERLRDAGGTRDKRNPGIRQTVNGAPLPIVLFHEIEPVLTSACIVQGLIPESGSIVVYGRSNSGKTFWVTDLALSIAAGVQWNGRRVERGAVIYAVLEGGNGFRNRVVAWRRKHGLDGEDIPFAAIPAPINLLDPAADTKKLIATIQCLAKALGIPVKLVVIDTLSRALAGGNENAPDDMGALVRNMDSIRQETGAAVLFIHHSGKDEARGARGHTLLVAALDTEIEVTDADGQRTATVTKQRDLEKGGEFGFTLRVIELGIDRHGDPVTTCVVEHGEACSGGATRHHKLTPAERKAKQFLSNLIAAEGKPLPEAPGFPTAAGLHGVSEIRWREECESWRLCTAEAKKVRSQAFRRAFDGLLSAGAVAARDDLVWLTNSYPSPGGST